MSPPLYTRCSRRTKQPGKQRFQGVPRSHDGERRESSDERAAGDIGHVVLTSVDAGQPDEPRKDQGGDAGALRNQEQRYGNREGERRMVAGKRRVMRRLKQERGSLDGEGTWSAPDANEDLVHEQ